jgi:hypothetical protein
VARSNPDKLVPYILFAGTVSYFLGKAAVHGDTAQDAPAHPLDLTGLNPEMAVLVPLGLFLVAEVFDK